MGEVLDLKEFEEFRPMTDQELIDKLDARNTILDIIENNLATKDYTYEERQELHKSYALTAREFDELMNIAEERGVAQLTYEESVA